MRTTIDIVSDVAEKADTQRLAAGLNRLRGFAMPRGGGVISSLPSSASVGTRGAEISGRHDFVWSLRHYDSSAGASVAVRAEPKSPATLAAEKFEAFVLQTWLEALLPKTEGGSFGTDGSANVWRSMMAEQLGLQLARSGGVGLQKMIAAHPVSPGARAPAIGENVDNDFRSGPEGAVEPRKANGIS